MIKKFKVKDKIITIESSSNMTYKDIKYLLRKLSNSPLLDEVQYGYAWTSDSCKVSKLTLTGSDVHFSESDIILGKDSIDSAMNKPSIRIDMPEPYTLFAIDVIVAKTADELKDKMFKYMSNGIN